MRARQVSPKSQVGLSRLERQKMLQRWRLWVVPALPPAGRSEQSSWKSVVSTSFSFSCNQPLHTLQLKSIYKLRNLYQLCNLITNGNYKFLVNSLLNRKKYTYYNQSFSIENGEFILQSRNTFFPQSILTSLSSCRRQNSFLSMCEGFFCNCNIQCKGGWPFSEWRMLWLRYFWDLPDLFTPVYRDVCHTCEALVLWVRGYLT